MKASRHPDRARGGTFRAPRQGLFPMDSLRNSSHRSLEILAVRLSPSRPAGRPAAPGASVSGRSLDLPLPLATRAHPDALGIPRLDMDLALLEEAARLGVEIVEGFEVHGVKISGGIAAGVSGSARPVSRRIAFDARCLLAADGRDSNDRTIARPAGRRRPTAPRRSRLTSAVSPGSPMPSSSNAFRVGYVECNPSGRTRERSPLIDSRSRLAFRRIPMRSCRNILPNPRARQSWNRRAYRVAGGRRPGVSP